jgi:hypothetical protein
MSSLEWKNVSKAEQFPLVGKRGLIWFNRRPSSNYSFGKLSQGDWPDPAGTCFSSSRKTPSYFLLSEIVHVHLHSAWPVFNAVTSLGPATRCPTYSSLGNSQVLWSMEKFFHFRFRHFACPFCYLCNPSCIRLVSSDAGSRVRDVFGHYYFRPDHDFGHFRKMGCDPDWSKLNDTPNRN